ncbi:MAG TPA: DsbA family protein, partial [Stellaceae bacterium]|nr:DsbA family protein [Stellaceae bacterium]
ANDRDIAAAAEIDAIVAALSHDPVKVRASALRQSNKDRLVAQGDAALSRGIFGAPSFLVGDELFWGNDRLDQAVAWALAPRPLPALFAT